MKVIKKTVYSMPEFIKAIVALTNEGKEIDLHWTRGSYGQAYVVAYKEADEESIEPIIVTTAVVDEDVAEDLSTSEVQEEAQEQATQEEATTETKKPVGRGRKASK